MSLSPSKLNSFLMFKLPAAFFTGVRVKLLNDISCIVTVKYRWINQNPFKSMFWAVQGMAAELATGALLVNKIKESNTPISMLVLKNKGSFLKKAKGKITFTCEDGKKVNASISEVLKSNEGNTIWLKAIGRDEVGDVVSEFEFEWTLKRK